MSHNRKLAIRAEMEALMVRIRRVRNSGGSDKTLKHLTDRHAKLSRELDALLAPKNHAKR